MLEKLLLRHHDNVRGLNGSEGGVKVCARCGVGLSPLKKTLSVWVNGGRFSFCSAKCGILYRLALDEVNCVAESLDSLADVQMPGVGGVFPLAGGSLLPAGVFRERERAVTLWVGTSRESPSER